MTIIDFIRIILRNKLLLIFFPAVLSISVFFFTKNSKRNFISRSLIYTGLASGMDIATLDNPLMSFGQVNNSFDNLINTIKSRETMEDLAMTMMARHLMMAGPTPSELSTNDFKRLHKLLKPEETILLVDSTLEATYNNILKLKNSSQKNPITKILDSSGEIYSVNVISKNLTVTRKQSSDMLELSYTAHDPIIAQSTLNLLIGIIGARYKSLKVNESTDVIAYFKDQIQKTLDDLNKKEGELKDYCVKHGVLNYYEQSKFVSEAKVDAETALDAEKQSYQAARESEKKLSNQMASRERVSKTNGEIVQLQNQLAKVNNLYAAAEIADNKPLKEKYRLQATKLKADIQKMVDDMYGYSNTDEGVPRNTLLNNYLSKSIDVEESKSKIKVIEQRLSGFSQEYEHLAPIGSEIKKIERKILIAEQTYLATLKNFEEAKLKQKSLELSKNLAVVDAPSFPLKSEPSKRMMLVIAAGFLGFVFPLSILIALFLIDNSIKTPKRIEKLTQLKVTGVLHHAITANRDEVDLIMLEKMLFDQFNSSLVLQEQEMGITDEQSRRIQLFSIKAGEGKSHFGIRLAQSLVGMNRKILYFYPEQSASIIKAYNKLHGKNDQLYTIAYSPDLDFIRAPGHNYLFEKFSLNEQDYHTIILELPALLNIQLPVNVVRDTNLSLLIVDSQRIWSSSDHHLLDLYHQALGHRKTAVILNKMSLENLENILGDIPKKRSYLRIILKRLIEFDFSFLSKKAVFF